jgi:LmbE family N-acetylglucosaminyl deacetylase
MKLSQSRADVFVPSGEDPSAALTRVTHLCIAAHQDDIEILAYDAICDCLDDPRHKAFGGVVVTDGGGSPRSGAYAEFTDEQMKDLRRQEQRDAAKLGGYAIQLQLAHPSSDVKRSPSPGLAADLTTIFSRCAPQVVYLHNPTDKHDTHVAVFLRTIEALRALPPDRRPARVLGGEVWRDLDWLIDTDKVPLDSGRRPDLSLALLQIFDSQVSGGKRYDLAAAGRRLAHATFHTSHATDRLQGITWAMDLTPLVHNPTLDVADFTLAHLDRLRTDILNRLNRFR